MKILRCIKAILDRDFYYAVISYSKTDGVLPYLRGGFLVGSTISFFIIACISVSLHYFSISIKYDIITIIGVTIANSLPAFLYTENKYKKIEYKYKNKKAIVLRCVWVYIKLFLLIAFDGFYIFKFGDNIYYF